MDRAQVKKYSSMRILNDSCMLNFYFRENPLMERQQRRKVTGRYPAMEGLQPAPPAPLLPGRRPHPLDPTCQSWHNRIVEIQKGIVGIHWILSGEADKLQLPPETKLSDLVEETFALTVCLGKAVNRPERVY